MSDMHHPPAPHLPTIALTLGDPGGVGPEIVAKALVRDEVRASCRPLVVGDAQLLQDAAQRLGLALHAVVVEEPGKALAPGEVGVYESEAIDRQAIRLGQVAAANGAAAYGWITAAARLALDGQVDGIVTAPISKEAMFAAGHRFPGHTELLAELCGNAEVRMMLEGGGVRVVLETIHVALAKVPALLTQAGIERTLEISHAWGERFLCGSPRIAVCGLNPHASEGGHFGDEEHRIITPALQAAASRGIRASGPYPADTIFHRMLTGEFDLVVAMYHDQALIPVKTLDFHRGVNITIGLPIVRTSPDHGTAFDIAGRGVANESSLVSATLRAAQMAARRCATEQGG